MKLRLALLVVVAQIAVVAFMAAEREWIARTGATIRLRTAPVDPNDPMRGEFVRFRYEISAVPASYFRGALTQWPKLTDYRAQRRLRDTVVYASLRVDEFGFAQLAALSDEKPADGLFLRGRVASVLGSADSQSVQVRYGIESLFMQQGAARSVETLAAGERRGVPIDTVVRLGSSGVGVLRTFEWEPLGITVTPDRPETPTQRRDQRAQSQSPLAGPTGLTVELKNFGTRDLAVVDQPDGKSFRLRADALSGPNAYRWVSDNLREFADPKTLRIVVLRPGEMHTVHLQLTEPRWWVEGGPDHHPAMPLVDVRDRWLARFRVEYVPPTPDQVRGLPNADLVRHVPLASRVFTAGVD